MKLTYNQRTGHSRLKTFKKRFSRQKTERRMVALTALEMQLEEGVKPANRKRETAEGLTEQDVVRIRKEIDVLKTRIRLGN